MMSMRAGCRLVCGLLALAWAAMPAAAQAPEKELKR
jgi:hypothetical protein